MQAFLRIPKCQRNPHNTTDGLRWMTIQPHEMWLKLPVYKDYIENVIP